MQIFKAILLSALLAGLVSARADGPKHSARSAASIVAAAETKAAAENKNVLLLFHASWCGWCHKLDDFLARPEIAPLIDANYVTIHVVVLESEDKKDLNNPGGDALLENLGGKDQGIPYYAILSPTNETLAVSKNDKGQNIGYPGADNEIPLFMKMLRSTSSHLTDVNATLIETELRVAGKKIADDQALTAKLYKPIQDALAKRDYSSALSASEDVIANHHDLAASAYYLRYDALLHVDEPKALSEIGRPWATDKPKESDSIRAMLIVDEDSLSDRAYNAALSILLKQHAGASKVWSDDNRLARAYSRVRKYKDAARFEQRAIDEAKTAKLPQQLIDSFVKAEADWQKAVDTPPVQR